jgi:tetrapyrrole methylase family protein/MazG family protein
MEHIKKEKYDFNDLTEIMRILRSEEGCPWDREQTHESIRNNFIEEVYEAVEAIDDDNPELLKEELGDVLLQVVFHAQISEEEKDFDINDVCDEICKKLIIRHTHIFSDTLAETSEQVLSNWENIKIKEKGYADTKQYLESIAKSLPALMRAEKIHKRLLKRKVINEPKIEDIITRLKCDIYELEKVKNNGTNKISELMSRTIYDIVCFSYVYNIDSEQALYDFNNNLIKNDENC